jgi:hypothetical protein
MARLQNGQKEFIGEKMVLVKEKPCIMLFVRENADVYSAQSRIMRSDGR